MPISQFQQFKLNVIQLTDLSRDALHLYAGLIIFFMVALLHRRQLSSKLAIAAVVLVAFAAELFDARDDIFIRGYWRVGASLPDIVNTVFWPLIIWLMARFKVWKN